MRKQSHTALLDKKRTSYFFCPSTLQHKVLYTVSITTFNPYVCSTSQHFDSWPACACSCSTCPNGSCTDFLPCATTNYLSFWRSSILQVTDNSMQKSIFLAAFVSALETALMLAPLGMLLYYPFVAAYEIPDVSTNLLYSVGYMLAFGAALAFLVLMPATIYLQSMKKGISRKELTGSLGTLAMVMVLTALLVYKGFEAPGIIGLRLLFGLLMSIMAVTWTFALRYDRKAKHHEIPA